MSTRFGIRDAIWLAIIILMLAAWGLDHRRMAAEIRKQPGLNPLFQMD